MRRPADQGANLSKALAPRLLRWYDSARRDLPWRRRPTPYRVWVAETMLQQTRIDTVLPYYRRFLRRFPSIAALARASVNDVLGVWAGLGYYARARRLHEAAREIVARFGGRIPAGPERLSSLPGVGRYTTGAVLSIAFGLRAPVVDGNVARVLCRLFALRGDTGTAPLQRRLWSIAAALVPARRPGDFNQALMELGSLTCTPNAPACLRCPVTSLCEARRLGRPERFPERTKRKPVPHYEVAVGLIRRRGKLLITKRPMDAMLGGLWEFPGGKIEPGESATDALRREVREETLLDVAVGEHLVSVRHAYSHFRVTLHAFLCDSPRGRVRPQKCVAFRWVDPNELDTYPFPSGSRKIIRHFLSRRRQFGAA